MIQKNISLSGTDIKKAAKALIMVHGRNGTAENILSIAPHLELKEFAILAPEAPGKAWYPNSFMSSPDQNEPSLSNSLGLLNEIVSELEQLKITKENIFFLGFSQGACLALEFTARNATRYGGVAAFTGGFIGDRIYDENFRGDFFGTPIFIGTSDPDPFIPVERVMATTSILKNMNASVTQRVYTNLGHMINQDEIDLANQLIFRT